MENLDIKPCLAFVMAVVLCVGCSENESVNSISKTSNPLVQKSVISPIGNGGGGGGSTGGDTGSSEYPETVYYGTYATWNINAHNPEPNAEITSVIWYTSPNMNIDYNTEYVGYPLCFNIRPPKSSFLCTNFSPGGSSNLTLNIHSSTTYETSLKQFYLQAEVHYANGDVKKNIEIQVEVEP